MAISGNRFRKDHGSVIFVIFDYLFQSCHTGCHMKLGTQYPAFKQHPTTNFQHTTSMSTLVALADTTSFHAPTAPSSFRCCHQTRNTPSIATQSAHPNTKREPSAKYTNVSFPLGNNNTVRAAIKTPVAVEGGVQEGKPVEAAVRSTAGADPLRDNTSQQSLPSDPLTDSTFYKK